METDFYSVDFANCFNFIFIVAVFFQLFISIMLIFMTVVIVSAATVVVVVVVVIVVVIVVVVYLKAMSGNYYKISHHSRVMQILME